jgi:Wnt-binding factor required for Wnt secretion
MLQLAILLCTTITYYYYLQILSPAPRFFFDLYVILLASFLCLMLVFWLDMFSDMANGEMQGTDAAQLWQRSRRKAFKEYAPKIVLITLVWLTTILIYM